MRFPGQVADIETGLFQNGFRDYVGINTPWTMPNLGRYCAQCIQPKNRS